MSDKEILLSNIEKVHTTEMGIDRIKKNLKLDTNNVVDYCKNKVLDKRCNIYKQGKNWYCEIDNIKITIHIVIQLLLQIQLTNNYICINLCSY